MFLAIYRHFVSVSALVAYCASDCFALRWAWLSEYDTLLSLSMYSMCYEHWTNFFNKGTNTYNMSEYLARSGLVHPNYNKTYCPTSVLLLLLYSVWPCKLFFFTLSRTLISIFQPIWTQELIKCSLYGIQSISITSTWLSTWWRLSRRVGTFFLSFFLFWYIWMIHLSGISTQQRRDV